MLNFIKQLFQGSQPKECFCSKYEEDPSRKNTCKVCGHSITKHEDKCGKCTYVQQVATKDRKTPEQQEKDRVRRGKINGEVISTEETYVESLRQMVRFQHGLADCLDKKKLLTLFSNVESLLGLHEDMLKDFKANISSGGSDPSLAATFIKYGPVNTSTPTQTHIYIYIYNISLLLNAASLTDA